MIDDSPVGDDFQLLILVLCNVKDKSVGNIDCYGKKGNDILLYAIPEDKLKGGPPEVAQDEEDEGDLKPQDELVVVFEINAGAFYFRVIL